MSWGTREAVAVLLLTAVLGVAATVPRARPAAARPEPIAEAEARVAETQRAADEAVARHAVVVGEQQRVETRVAEVEARIPADEGEVARLQAAVEGRALELYKGHDPVSQLTFSTNDVVEAGRAEHLATTVTEGDLDTAEELQDAIARLRAEREELAVERVRLDQLRVLVEASAAVLEQQLAEAAAILADLETAAAESHIPVDGLLCPVDGPIAFTNDWGAPRSEGRTHEGTDVFGATGVPNVAIVSGTVTYSNGGLGGMGATVHGDDGNRYYYAHLSAFEGGARRVVQGDVIGYVGATGNAAGGSPHTHFQVHPGGGEPVNPYPTLRAICG